MERDDGNFSFLFIEVKAHMEQPSGDIQEASEIRSWNLGHRPYLEMCVGIFNLQTESKIVAVDQIAQKYCEICKNRKDGQNPKKQVVEISQKRETKKET